MKLESCEITSPIDKFRGSNNFRLVVKCTFIQGGERIVVPGFVVCKEESLEESLPKAIDNARGVAELHLSSNHSRVFREMIKEKIPGFMKELRKMESLETLERMYKENASKEKQMNVSGLCETLGIDNINIVDERDPWSMIEACVLIESLEKMVKSMGLI